MTDPISDMLTRMRNALAVNKLEVVIPFSKIKWNIAQILEREKWIQKAEEIKDKVDGRPYIKIIFRYDEKHQSVIKHLKRISKPGLRVYVKKDNIRKVLQGLGLIIISTSQGLLTGKEAKIKGAGGEIICEIY